MERRSIPLYFCYFTGNFGFFAEESSGTTEMDIQRVPISVVSGLLLKIGKADKIRFPKSLKGEKKYV